MLELCGNPAFGRSSSHGGLGAAQARRLNSGRGQEGPASAENQSWRMGHEERAVGSTTHHGNTRSATVSPAEGHKRESEEGAPERRRSRTRDGVHLSLPRRIPRKTPPSSAELPDSGLGAGRGRFHTSSLDRSMQTISGSATQNSS